MIFYELTPVDTLFFRGNEPLEAGQLSAEAIFPPPVSVVYGALRSAVLRERGISFSDYHADAIDDGLRALIGRSTDKAPFEVCGILLKKGDAVYAPAPYSWFVDTDKTNSREMCTGDLTVMSAGHVADETISHFGIRSSAGQLPIVTAKKNATSLGGKWIRLNLLAERTIILKEGDLRDAGDFFCQEQHTGISLLDENGIPTRKVKDGALFTANHIRLHDDVRLIIALDRECGLQKSGTLLLGGERKTCGYTAVALANYPVADKSGSLFTTLVPVAVTEENLKEIFCSGKLFATAGWDLRKGFHKDSCFQAPAGSVFRSNINGQMIALSLQSQGD